MNFTILMAISCQIVIAQSDVPQPDVAHLIGQLTQDDPAAVEKVQQQLKDMGADIVPAIFQRLMAADWDLKPRLLEVLSEHGQEFAKQKLLSPDSNEDQKVCAALAYELSVDCSKTNRRHDYGSPEYSAMVRALLKGMKSEDKSTRAACAAALLYDEHSLVFFDHLHEIVPALISCFDSELVIDRCVREGPAAIVLIPICLNLESLVGDRFVNTVRELLVVADRHLEIRDEQKRLRAVLSDGRAKVEGFRTYWQDWWNQHSQLSAAEIGRLMIERSLRVLASTKDDETTYSAERCLKKWSGSYELDWNAWWDQNKATYRGPAEHRRP